MKTTYFYRVAVVVFILGLSITLYGQEIKTINDLDASSKTAYFNLATGKKAADVTMDWDIAFNRTTVMINSGSSGERNVEAAFLKDTSFEKVTKPLDVDFKTDSEAEKAIPTGSGNGWYEYDRIDHRINPIPGRILVIKTSAGKYVKLEILSYYNKSNYSPANYSFRYSFL